MRRPSSLAKLQDRAIPCRSFESEGSSVLIRSPSSMESMPWLHDEKFDSSIT
jgi:hypothetical protein